MTSRLSWPRIALQALLAGIAGGALIDLYLWVTTMRPVNAAIASNWQWVASTVLGKAAIADPKSAAIGLAIHAIVSVGWAGGYAYIAAANPVANRRWAISGIVYGLIVYTIMQTILLADNNFTYPPTPNAFINALAAHALFFGLPVAYVVRATSARAA